MSDLPLRLLLLLGCTLFCHGWSLEGLQRQKREVVPPRCLPKYYFREKEQLCCPCSKCPTSNPGDKVQMDCYFQYDTFNGPIHDANYICRAFNRMMCENAEDHRKKMIKVNLTTTTTEMTTTTTTTTIAKTRSPTTVSTKKSDPLMSSTDKSTPKIDKAVQSPSGEILPSYAYMVLTAVGGALLVLVVAVCVVRFSQLREFVRKCRGCQSTSEATAVITAPQIPPSNDKENNSVRTVNGPSKTLTDSRLDDTVEVAVARALAAVSDKAAEEKHLPVTDPIVRSPHEHDELLKEDMLPSLSKKSDLSWDDRGPDSLSTRIAEPITNGYTKAQPFNPNAPAPPYCIPPYSEQVPERPQPRPQTRQPPLGNNPVSITAGENSVVYFIMGHNNNVGNNTQARAPQEPLAEPSLPRCSQPSINHHQPESFSFSPQPTPMSSGVSQRREPRPSQEPGTRPSHPMLNDHPQSQSEHCSRQIRGPPSRCYREPPVSLSDTNAKLFPTCHSDARTFDPLDVGGCNRSGSSSGITESLIRPPSFEEEGCSDDEEDLYSSGSQDSSLIKRPLP